MNQENKFKRNIAYKVRVGEVISGIPEIESDRLKNVKIDGIEVSRVNVVANVIEKFVQDGEKKFASLTLDDATGQIKVKTFGEEIEKFSDLSEGDTILVIGLLRTWNNEIYLTPEIIKKQSPSYLLVRKLEREAEKPKVQDQSKLTELKEKLSQMIKEAEKNEGIDIEGIIMKLKEHPDIINSEIKKLLEEGLIYEPRPGKLRWLG